MKKNLLFTFCFAFIPGAGQMYQSYMKRGLSIMTLTAVVFSISYLFSGVLFVAIPVIMAYSFFDTFYLRNLTDAQRAEFTDEYVWTNSKITEFLPDTLVLKRNKYIGYVLVILGGYYAFNQALDCFEYAFLPYKYVRIIKTVVRIVLIASVCIWVGLKMIKEQEKVEVEDTKVKNVIK